MTIQTNDAILGGDSPASDLRVLAVLFDEILLRVDGPRYEAGVQGLSQSLRTSRADAIWIFSPHSTLSLDALLLRIPSPTPNERFFSVHGWEAILEDSGTTGLLQVRAKFQRTPGLKEVTDGS